MANLRGFFVAWEADALPTELFPHSDFRVPYLDLGPKWGHSPTPILAWSLVPRRLDRRLVCPRYLRINRKHSAILHDAPDVERVFNISHRIRIQ